MQTTTPINKLLRTACLTLFAITLPSFLLGQSLIITHSLPTSINEGDSGNSFSVALSDAPTNNVEVAINSDNSDLSFSSTSLTFDNTNYSTAQTITFTANEDADLVYENDPITISVVDANSDAAYHGKAQSIALTINDNDIAGLIITGGPFDIDENTTGHSFTVALNAQPQTDVQIAISSLNADIIFSPATLTFTNSDWAAKTVTFDAPEDDDLISENEPISIAVYNDNSDDDFDNLSQNINLTITDNDIAGLVITGGPFTIDENTTGHSFTVALNAQPQTDVQVAISSLNADIIFSPATLTFTNSDWAAQTVTFDAPEDDDLINENDPISIAVNNPNSDDDFDNLSQNINLTITDNDVAGLVITGGPFSI
ncbi:hypothetical protein, partial [uncultured Carboxylicivirga sp.]